MKEAIGSCADEASVGVQFVIWSAGEKLLQVFGSKRQYSGGSWALTLPKNWSRIEEEDYVVSFAAHDGCGALQLSSYIKDEAVSNNDLLDFSEEMGILRSDLKTTRQGEFTGFAVEGSENGMWFRTWYLRCGSTMVFATYNCEADDQGVENRLVDGMLSTLVHN